MGRKATDLTGLKFGTLTALLRADGPTHEARWLCLCTCGIERVYVAGKLKRGDAKCYCDGGRDVHGLTGDPLYTVWANMKDRCSRSTCESYQNYGGRGVFVCQEWVVSFPEFRAWALDNGWSKGLQLDRADNDGPYAPSNCRFVNHKQNNRNKRTNVRVTVAGVDKTLVEWAELNGLQPQTINNRIRRGWTQERAVTAPLDFSTQFQKGERA